MQEVVGGLIGMAFFLAAIVGGPIFAYRLIKQSNQKIDEEEQALQKEIKQERAASAKKFRAQERRKREIAKYEKEKQEAEDRQKREEREQREELKRQGYYFCPKCGHIFHYRDKIEQTYFNSDDNQQYMGYYCPECHTQVA
jgi:rubrerythrin